MAGLASGHRALGLEPKDRMKTKPAGGASVREQKAAALDSLVKTELAKKRAADAAKISKLKALRLAREAEMPEPEIVVQRTERKPRLRKSSPPPSGA
jgi:hypothetical protein